MTREVVKKLLPIIKAFAEGKTIQFRTNNRSWVDLVDNNLEINVLFEYRIKPEPKYRPFKNQEECWNEMLKHKPLGWIKYSNFSCIIQNISLNGITVIKEQEIHYLNFEEHFMNIEFADETPFGIKEE